MSDFSKFPNKFIKRSSEILSKKELDDFLKNSTEPLPKTIRIINYQNNFRENFPKDWQFEEVEKMSSVFFVNRKNHKPPLGKTLEHFTGKIYIASLSSLLSAEILNPKIDEKVLDLCSAPGSKTTFLAEKIGRNGVVIANELSSSRIKKLTSNIDRLGLNNVVITQNNGINMHKFIGQEFDKILLDAPCSSEGFGRKNSNFFMKNWHEKNIFECSRLQKQLIVSAFSMLRENGEMVYSTCTSTPEENEEVVDFLLKKFPEAEILPIDLAQIPYKKGLEKFAKNSFSAEISQNSVRLFPHLKTKKWDSEIFFITRIYKKSSLKISPAIKNFSDKNLIKLSKNKTAEIFTSICKSFGIEKSVFKNAVLAEKNGEIFLTNNASINFAKKNKYQRLGFKIIDKNENITSYFAIHFGKFATKNFIKLNDENSHKFLAGYDLNIKNLKMEKNLKFKNTIIVKSGSFAIGWGKLLNEKLKNKLDRNLVF